MASAFLLRDGSRIDFESINLRTRELGYQKDDEYLFLGTPHGNKHIPDRDYVDNMINVAIGRKVTKTLAAESNSLIASLVFKMVSFEYSREVIIKYDGIDFVDYDMDEEGNYTEINPPVVRSGLFYVPGNLTAPVSGETIVATMKESKNSTANYYCVLNSEHIMTIYLDCLGQTVSEKGVFVVQEPAGSSLGFPSTVEPEAEDQ